MDFNKMGMLLSGPIYSCFDCGFHLDKKCFELPREINHPFHHKHPIILDKHPNPTKDTCSFCQNPLGTPLYHCTRCGFNLHIKCALLTQLDPGAVVKLQHFSHEAHPLIMIEKHNLEDPCLGCMKKLSGPIYSCFDCMFNLHKNCAELPVQIEHTSHRRHPLKLLANLPTQEGGCEGFVYYCRDCKFWKMAKDISLLPTGMPKIHDHEHTFTPVSRQISFICDFCGNPSDGHETAYVCPPCHLVVHNDCISSFPSTIRIGRHPYKIHHIYYLQEKEFKDWECRICHENVNTEHGSYYCEPCSYIVHVRCATDPFIWDRNADLDDEDQNSEEALRSLITDVIELIKDGNDEIAAKIKHLFHEHELSLTLTATPKDGLNQDDKICDGCMKPISVPLYSCQKCEFFLHKHCAELPERKQVPLHRHPLYLSKPHPANKLSNCESCLSFHHGFTYRCKKCEFDIDIQCSLFSDTLENHKSHEHLLFLDHRYETSCSGCLAHIASGTDAFRCKYCEFVLDFKCITLPVEASHKYDPHPLSLTYIDHSDPNQHYCDICEEARNPQHCFYHCEDCDNSVHIECVLGEVPHVKSGKMYRVSGHSHPLVFVKKIWDLPVCKVCGTLCKIQFLECASGCDFTIHWRCKDAKSEMQRYNDESEKKSEIGFLEMQSLFRAFVRE